MSYNVPPYTHTGYIFSAFTPSWDLWFGHYLSGQVINQGAKLDTTPGRWRCRGPWGSWSDNATQAMLYDRYHLAPPEKQLRFSATIFTVNPTVCAFNGVDSSVVLPFLAAREVTCPAPPWAPQAGRQAGRQAAHPPHRASPAVGNGEDGRAATTETRRQGKDRPLHPRRHARSGNIRESEELSHAFVSMCTFAPFGWSNVK